MFSLRRMFTNRIHKTYIFLFHYSPRLLMTLILSLNIENIEKLYVLWSDINEVSLSSN